jgi:glucosamine--fructose-6-phosphate aminotransferase (isomerizing)
MMTATHSGRGDAAAATRAASATRMAEEAAQAPARVQAQLDLDTAIFAELSARLASYAPRVVITCARGSSDHAATFARYLIETQLGLLTSSASPSLNSVYAVRQDLRQCLFLAISQSGQSPDLIASAQAARAAGAFVVTLVNAEDSPLSACADFNLPMRAGLERSVAATKSFICSLSAIIHLVGHWGARPALLQALQTAPALLNAAAALDWSPLVKALQPEESLLVLGRGLGLGVAQEAALKLKETCGVHAEAFSSAEVRHGPMALVSKRIPVLLFAQDDQTRAGQLTLATELAASGSRLLLAGAQLQSATILPTLRAPAAIEPLLWVQSFYRATAELAIARGLDPDQPPLLRKVTETL